MLNNLKRLVRHVSQATTASTTRSKPARRAFLGLENLETRTLLSAAPVSFVLDDSGNLFRVAGNSRKLVDTDVQTFQRDSKGEVYALTDSDDLHVLNSAGSKLQTIQGVTSITANLEDGGFELFRESGELDEIAGGKVAKLGVGVDDFQENTTGAVDMLFSSGELEEWRGGKITNLGSGVDDFQEEAGGTVEISHSDGEVDQWHGGKLTRLKGPDQSEHNGGELENQGDDTSGHGSGHD